LPILFSLSSYLLINSTGFEILYLVYIFDDVPDPNFRTAFIYCSYIESGHVDVVTKAYVQAIDPGSYIWRDGIPAIAEPDVTSQTEKQITPPLIDELEFKFRSHILFFIRTLPLGIPGQVPSDPLSEAQPIIDIK